MINVKYFSPVFFAIVSFAACTNAPESDEAKTSEAKEVSEASSDRTLKIDPSSSKLEWIGTKVSGYHTGVVNIKSGEVKITNGNITGGRFVIDMNTTIVSGPQGSDPGKNDKLAGHLKSADFFEVSKYPEAVFEITEVKPYTGTIEEPEDPRQEEISEYKVTNPTHTVSGNLTIKETTKNVQFPARISITDNSAEAIAKFNIDRTQWDLVYPGAPDDLIKNEIHLGISVKATE